MKLYRLKLRPLSSWMTPWQADTLSGSLCWAAARHLGSDALNEEILKPTLAGEPPFVLSDAFPGDLLPIPITVKLHHWEPDVRKEVKRARWITLEAFNLAQRGEPPRKDGLFGEELIQPLERIRNTISRTTDTTGDEGSLFPTQEFVLDTSSSLTKETPYLSVYVRVGEGFEERLIQLFRLLEANGFGADASVGYGRFEVIPTLEPVDWLDVPADSINGLMTLSTFQPAQNDPTDGYWELLMKYGKVGADFGLENVFKKPLVMLKPGACFRSRPFRPYLGRAIPMSEILPKEITDELQAMEINMLHYAFGLAVPFILNEGVKN